MDIAAILPELVTVGAIAAILLAGNRRLARDIGRALLNVQENGNGTDTAQLEAITKRVAQLETENEELARRMANLQKDAMDYLKKGAQRLRRAEELTGVEDEEVPEPTAEELADVQQLELGAPEPEHNGPLTLNQIRALARG